MQRLAVRLQVSGSEPKRTFAIEGYGVEIIRSTMPYVLFCLLILVCGDCVAISTYEVSVDASLQHVDVKLCLDRRDRLHPADLHIDSDARANIERLRWQDQPLSSLRQLQRLRLREGADNCLDYRARLQRPERSWAAASDDYRLTRSKDWLLAPPHGSRAWIRFITPQDMAVSAPWPPVPTDDHSQDWMLLGQTDPWWSNNVVFGRFRVEQLAIGNSTLRIAILPSSPTLTMADVRPWLLASAESVRRVHGSLPQADPQVLIMPVGRQNEAIPFARVMRGGGVGLQFFVDPNRTADDFAQDWKPTHEFSHLLFPYISRDDAWLSEGLSSYFQNMLRARDGRLSEREAWEKLLAGFERGRRDRKRNVTLAEEASGMHRYGSYMRVYWSGAAMLLLADKRLREASDDAHSLDTALAALADCCMDDPGQVWRARDIMRKLDELTGHQVFMNIFHQYAHSDRFPHVQPALRSLGVIERDGRVQLDDAAEQAALRHALTSFPAQKPPAGQP